MPNVRGLFRTLYLGFGCIYIYIQMQANILRSVVTITRQYYDQDCWAHWCKYGIV